MIKEMPQITQIFTEILDLINLCTSVQSVAKK